MKSQRSMVHGLPSSHSMSKEQDGGEQTNAVLPEPGKLCALKDLPATRACAPWSFRQSTVTTFTTR
jgi:hypothetical protein